MRTIKFRGQSVMDGKWFHGDLINSDGFTNPRIRYLYDDAEFLEEEVMSETVGQFTGLLDKNGSEIYEGDLIEGELSFWMEEYEHVETHTGAVFFTEGTFVIESDIYANMPIIQLNNIQIIGNIHDNPELL